MFIEINGLAYNLMFAQSIDKLDEDGKYKILYAISNENKLVEEFDNETDRDAKYEAAQAAGGASKEEIAHIEDEIERLKEVGFHPLKVEELPTEDIKDYILYLVPSDNPEEENLCYEYLYINNAWEMVGTTSVDLSNYYTKDEVDDRSMFNIALPHSTFEGNFGTIDQRDYQEFLPLLQFLYTKCRGEHRFIKLPFVNIYTAHDAPSWYDFENSQLFVVHESYNIISNVLHMALNGIPKFDSSGVAKYFSLSINGVIENDNVAYIQSVTLNKSTLPVASKSYVDDALANIDLSKVTGFINLHNNSSNNPLVLSTLEPGMYIVSNDTWSGASFTMVARPGNRSTTIFDFDLNRFACLFIENKIPEVYDNVRRSVYLSIKDADRSGVYIIMDDGYSLTQQWNLSKELLTTSTSQTITSKKTFNTLPESSVTPTTNNQLTNKKYVDDSVAAIPLPTGGDNVIRLTGTYNFFQNYDNGYTSFNETDRTALQDYINNNYDGTSKSLLPLFFINDAQGSYTKAQLIVITDIKIDNTAEARFTGYVYKCDESIGAKQSPYNCVYDIGMFTSHTITDGVYTLSVVGFRTRPRSLKGIEKLEAGTNYFVRQMAEGIYITSGSDVKLNNEKISYLYSNSIVVVTNSNTYTKYAIVFNARDNSNNNDQGTYPVRVFRGDDAGHYIDLDLGSLATKQYVDDAISGVSPIVGVTHSRLGTDSTNSWWVHSYNINTEIGNNSLGTLADVVQSVYNDCISYIKDVNLTHLIRIQALDDVILEWKFGNSTSWSPKTYRSYVNIFYKNSGLIAKRTIYANPNLRSDGTIESWYNFSWGDTTLNALGTNNTTSYTPTADYHPATKKYVDDNKGQTIQYSTMPTASASTLGKIVQYTGATDSTYTNGYFYCGVSDGANIPIYSWEQINVQPSLGGVDNVKVLYLDNYSSSSNALDMSTLDAGIYIILRKSSGNTLYMKPRAGASATGLQNATGSNYLTMLIYNNQLPETYDYNSRSFTIYQLNPNFYTYWSYTDTGTDFNRDWGTAVEGVDLASNQTITGIKTFSTLPVSSTTPTGNNQLVNKQYVDTAIASAITNALGGNY